MRCGGVRCGGVRCAGVRCGRVRCGGSGVRRARVRPLRRLRVGIADLLAAQKARDRRQQRVDVDRLGDVGAAAGGQHLLLVSRHRIGGERDDRQGDAATAQLPGGVVTIEHRHLHVHQHQVEAAGRDLVERDLAVFRFVDPQAVLGEHQRHQFAVLRTVIDHQHARGRDAPAAASRGGRVGVIGMQIVRRKHRRAVRRAGGEAQREHTAGASAAGGHDVAAQGARELATDGEPQPGATEAPGDRRVRLGEGVEHAFEPVGRHADAGIAHFDLVAAAAWRGSVGRGVIQHHAHAAGLGELDRVRQQVEHDLAQARGVRIDRRRYRATHLHLQRDALFIGLDAQFEYRLAHDRMRGAGHGFHVQSTGFDLGKIENVVDQFQQVLAAGVDGVQVAGRLAFALAVAALEQFGEAENRVHRRADLVAHVGQEFTLGAIGGVRFVARGLEFGLAQFELGDVLQADQHAARLAGRAEHRRAVDREGAQAGVGGDQFHGAAALHFAAGERALPGRFGGERQARFVQPGDALGGRAHQLLVALA